MDLFAGELKHKIKIQRLSNTVNSNGFNVETWVDIRTVYAKVQNLSGREYWQASAVQAENTVKFFIKYIRMDIDNTMRLYFKGKQYNIVHVDNATYENKIIVIKALEVTE